MAPFSGTGPSFQEFIALKEEIDRLCHQLDEMKPGIVAAVHTAGGRVVHGLYQITVRHRVTYEYSEYVAAAEAHLAAVKQIEQQNGTARVSSFTEFPYTKHR